MIAAQASIIADGTIDGAPFTFTSGVTVEQELEGNPWWARAATSP
ncbi:MAG TPA: hypothetical protein VMK66_10535 [Myxococcales bacterium]|nr:hypothetical protein [Myxococcales bacterium]